MKEKLTVLMLKGLPASGKSTLAKLFEERGFVRVNKDEIREMFQVAQDAIGKKGRVNEKNVIDTEDSAIDYALSRGKSVVVDDTNLNPIHEERIRKIAKRYNAEFYVHTMKTSFQECLKRDKTREKTVGAKVINQMFNQYYAQSYQFEKVKENLTPTYNAYIFDIDGTLALKGDRSPYDEARVIEDTLNYRIADILRQLKQVGNRIIIVSGRHDTCRTETATWLRNSLIPFDLLFMREADDNRNDAIVKYEIFKNYIEGKFTITAVFDDRDRVVKMWREIGLTCCQVAYGDF